MSKVMEVARSKYAAAGAAVTTLGLAAPGTALAAQDYSELETSATGEITAAIPIGLGILALVIGIPLAVKILRRIAG